MQHPQPLLRNQAQRAGSQFVQGDSPDASVSGLPVDRGRRKAYARPRQQHICWCSLLQTGSKGL